MVDSILETVKNSIPIDPECKDFDSDIIMYINAGLATLTQIGVGPEQGYILTDQSQTWSSFLGARKDLEGAKSYISIYTKLVFDPPQSSFVTESLKRIMDETLWRLSVTAGKVT